MDKKLAEYRAKKRREEQFNQYKQNVKAFIMSFLPSKQKIDKEDTELIIPPYKHDDDDIPDSDDETDSVDSSVNCPSHAYMTWVLYFLSFVLWFTVYMVFLKLDFGTVYIIVSVLIFIFLNTRTGEKPIGEISAYSVFNKNCESIDGTLKAEQFEREIRYGSGAVK